MAKRSKLLDDSTVEEVQVTAVSDEILVRSLIAARVIMVAPSGKTYIFGRGGAEVKVDEQDVNFFLQKRKSGLCCGGQQDKALFELVE